MNCQLVESTMSSCRDSLTSSSPTDHRRAQGFQGSGGEVLNPVKSKELLLLTSMGQGFHP